MASHPKRKRSCRNPQLNETIGTPTCLKFAARMLQFMTTYLGIAHKRGPGACCSGASVERPSNGSVLRSGNGTRRAACSAATPAAAAVILGDAAAASGPTAAAAAPPTQQTAPPGAIFHKRRPTEMWIRSPLAMELQSVPTVLLDRCSLFRSHCSTTLESGVN